MPSRMSCPSGVCIQLLAERIQNADSVVPIATRIGGDDVQQRVHAVPAEQHDPEEGGLEEERRQHFVADERPDDVADDDREAAPVRAELIGEHDAGDDAHRERDGEDLRPEAGEVAQVLAPGHAPAHEQRRDERGEPDREAREDDMEGDRERELDACEEKGVNVHVVLPAAQDGAPALRADGRDGDDRNS